MKAPRLRTRYALAVLGIGLALTVFVALVDFVTESRAPESRGWLVFALGGAFSALGALATYLLMSRIDRAMQSLMASAERIGRLQG